MSHELLFFFALLGTVCALVLAAHATRATLTMAPLYAVAGIITMLEWEILQLGWWVSWGEFQVNAASLAMVPPLMTGMVLAYAMDGVRAARAYLVVILATALIAWAFSEFRNALSAQVPIPYVFDLSTRAYAGVFAGLGAGAALGVLSYEGSSRVVPRPAALALGVVVAALGELLVRSVLTYGPRTGWLSARAELVEYLVVSLVPAALALGYGALVLRWRGLLPARPVSEVLRFWASTESNLREAREDVLTAHQVISDLRSLNYQLAEAKRINDYLLSQSPLAVVQTDRDDRIRFVNAAAERLFSGSSEELAGTSLLARIADERGEPLGGLTPITSAAQGRTVQVSPREGARRVAEMLVMELFDARGRAIGHHVTLKDVTEAVQARSKRAMEDKVRGIHRTGRMITHDFSHLLLGLQGAVERALDSGDREELARACEAVRSGVERGRDLLRQLGAGQAFTKPYLVSTDLRTVLDEAVGICRSAALDKGVRLTLGDFEPVNVSVDATQINRVFTNLISNAVRATPAGSAVEVSATAEGAGVTVEVRDDGPGMSAAEIEGAFDPAYSTKGGGAGGLGLAISYLMVEAHGGNLRLDADRARGLRAIVWLPVAGEHVSLIGDGALLVALEDDRLAEGLIRQWEDRGGAAIETRSMEELEAMLHDDPQDWDLVVIDREPDRALGIPECTVIQIDRESRTASLRRAGRRDDGECDALLDWVRQTVAA